MTKKEKIQQYALIQNASDIKALACVDLFFLLYVIMGRKDMNKDWLYQRCLEVSAKPDGYLDLWAREHYKSTIITVALTIQEILKNPSITIGIFSHTRGIAKAFLDQIRREFEQNELLQALFPHIQKPIRNSKAVSRPWSEEKFTVLRDANPKEATVEAWGLVDGQPTGKHFDILIYDDVVTLESVSTSDQIRKCTQAWELSLNLGARNGKIRMIGTRYHLLDSYHDILQKKTILPRIHPATHDGTESGEGVLLTKDELVQKRKNLGAYVFACQMLQNPSQDSMQSFKEHWLKFWDVNEKHWALMHRAIIVDPANSLKESSDYTAIFVIGRNFDGKYYIIDMLRDRLTLSQRTALLFSLVRKYSPHLVAYESYGMQADIAHIKEKQVIECFNFSIIPVAGSMKKFDRIKRLEVDFEQGNIFLPSNCFYKDYTSRFINMLDVFTKEEYLLFPMLAHDDMLDSLARIHDINLHPPKSHSPRRLRKKEFSIWD